jgi:tetratricopeptide (TPR) repeat protein
VKHQGGILVIGCVVVISGAVVELLAAQPGSGTSVAAITIDYPLEGSVFPPEITPPTFLWRDVTDRNTRWGIDVVFADGSPAIYTTSRGELASIGEIDPRGISKTNELPEPAMHGGTRTWVPDAETWAAIKKHSVTRPATVTITGFPDLNSDRATSRGQVTIGTSKDPVGAPIFYRDVPLMPSETERGLIKPLAAGGVKLVAWRLRNIAESRSRLLLENLPTCANCHSFSSDGKTLGMDVDGPENDKGTYAIVPITPQISIRNENVITWNSFPDKPKGHSTIGFMSQLSPDGQYAVSTVNEEVYVANFLDYRFLQVFYPTRGILAWYSQMTGRIQALPGADDPRYVDTDAVWTPDGKDLIFARAEAKDPYSKDRKLAEYANDPNESPIQYDLYRISFNTGKGGRPQPIAGAGRNGMSNSFPKVSPDGRWIVFVQSRNGQLMRPDSQLYIVPVEGGQARRMRCNTPLMNSWHSFSPNGRWMVFSSKSRSPYTQMFLTHLDEEGRDSPAILIENATAANRAVNIPEFVNIPQAGLLKIDVPAAEFYQVFDRALDLLEKGQYEAAIAEWNKALEISPEDAKAHNNLGIALVRQGRIEEAITHFQKATEINSRFDRAEYNLGCAFAKLERPDQAIAHWQRALVLNPSYADAHNDLGAALFRKGRLDEAIVHLQRALEIDPRHIQAQNTLGQALARRGNLDEAITHWRQALTVDPKYAEAHNNLGVALFRKGSFDEAIMHFQKALETDPEYAQAHYSLGRALAEKGRMDEAMTHWNRALAINPEDPDAHSSLGNAFYLRGEVSAAISHWRVGLRAQPDHLPLLNQMAWALATSPEASVRNGVEAVTLAKRAVELSGGREPMVLDTLGAAYAETGRFPEALLTARRALALATEQNNQALAQGVKARIRLYEAKTPFREMRQPSSFRRSSP